MALNDDQLDLVRQTLATRGWNEVMQPFYLNRGRQALKLLALYPAERAGELKDLEDDQLRAVVRECEWMTNVWRNELQVAEHNRRLEEAEREREAGNPPTANP